MLHNLQRLRLGLQASSSPVHPPRVLPEDDCNGTSSYSCIIRQSSCSPPCFDVMQHLSYTSQPKKNTKKKKTKKSLTILASSMSFISRFPCLIEGTAPPVPQPFFAADVQPLVHSHSWIVPASASKSKFQFFSLPTEHFLFLPLAIFTGKWFKVVKPITEENM